MSTTSIALSSQVASRSLPNQFSKTKEQGLPLTRPRIVIPAKALTLARTDAANQSKIQGPPPPVVSVITPKGSSSSSSSSSSRSTSDAKEKIGRWSEEEHKVFLEGLGKHGKQWKVIAGMIGTRTVVQVRTHAQKYFQRMERHNNNNKTSQAKRKMSLPPSLPSRAKKSKGLKKVSIPRSASITLVSPTSEPPLREM